MTDALRIDDESVSLSHFVEAAYGKRSITLSQETRWRDKIQRGRAVLEKLAKSGQKIYGVNTGFGRTSRRQLDDANAALQLNLIRMHGCGVGPYLHEDDARAVMLARLLCLAKGYSGVRLDLLEMLQDTLNASLTPCIPSYGSVGASGDLTPLSYLGALLAGERQARLQGEILPAQEALQRVGLKPFSFAIREGLALINGTSMMTALAALTCARTARLLDYAERATALALEMADGRSQAMHPTIHQVKAHPGQITSAANILAHLQGSQYTTQDTTAGREVQDRYSIRCAPHLLGAARDALSWAQNTIQTELNSVNDNPIVDPDAGTILNGGNFYGGHVALAMDTLKITLGTIINLFDRQFAFLIGDANPQLPETMLPTEWLPPEEAGLHHGLKALQITLSSLTALTQQRSFSDTLLSRQTECDNQDIVSMGSNASLNARATLEFAEMGLCAWLIALSQAAAIRGEDKLAPASLQLVQTIRKSAPVVRRDRPLDQDIQQLQQQLLSPPR